MTAQMNSDEESRILRWRRATAADDAHSSRLSRVWDILSRLQTPLANPTPSAEELIAQAGIIRLPTTEQTEARRGSASRRGRLRPAYLVLLGSAIAATVAVAILFSPQMKADDHFGVREFIAGPLEANTIRLADGTIVRLAPGSRIAFDGRSTRERQVTFEGVGYFAVAKDTARPFIIRTKGGDAQVLGTRFELRTEDEAMRVVVVEGRVALKADGQRTTVGKNQMGRAGVNQPPTVVDVEDVNDFIGWVNGLLVFQATPLRQVAQELAEHYRVQVEISDEELAQREVTAWLREQSFEAAMTAVCGAVGATCIVQRDRATMNSSRSTRRTLD